VPAAGNVDGRGRVLDRLAETVREEIGRAHQVDELRVERPAAGRLEILGFEQHMLGTATREGGDGEKGGEERDGEREAEGGVHGGRGGPRRTGRGQRDTGSLRGWDQEGFTRA
jgi:hypothetical protein